MTTHSDIQTKIQDCQAAGQHRFDPVRFQHIAALVTRSEHKNARVSAKLQDKASTLLQSYKGDLEKAKVVAQQTADQVALSFPRHAAEVTELFGQYNFREISRFADRLQFKAKQRKAQATSLTGLFDPQIEEEETHQEQLSFEEFLQEQESQALRSHNESEAKNSAHFEDLKSHKLFKDTWVKLHSDKLVAQAIEGAPQDAGPLNSHMLAVKSLQSMQALSPEYLYRFVAYTDALLWLQNVEVALTQPQKKPAKKRAKRKS